MPVDQDESWDVKSKKNENSCGLVAEKIASYNIDFTPTNKTLSSQNIITEELSTTQSPSRPKSHFEKLSDTSPAALKFVQNLAVFERLLSPSSNRNIYSPMNEVQIYDDTNDDDDDDDENSDNEKSTTTSFTPETDSSKELEITPCSGLTTDDKLEEDIEYDDADMTNFSFENLTKNQSEVYLWLQSIYMEKQCNYFFSIGYDDINYIKSILHQDELVKIGSINLNVITTNMEDLPSPPSILEKESQSISDILEFVGLSKYSDLFEGVTLENIFMEEKEARVLNIAESLPIGHWKRILHYVNEIKLHDLKNSKHQSDSNNSKESLKRENLSNSSSGKKKPILVKKIYKHYGDKNPPEVQVVTNSLPNICKDKNMNELENLQLEINIGDDRSFDNTTKSSSSSSSPVSKSARVSSFNKEGVDSDTRSLTLSARKKKKFLLSELEPHWDAEKFGSHTQDVNQNNLQKNSKKNSLKMGILKEGFKSLISMSLQAKSPGDFESERFSYSAVAQFYGAFPLAVFEDKSRRLVEEAFMTLKSRTSTLKKIPHVVISITSEKVQVKNNENNSIICENEMREILTCTQYDKDMKFFCYTVPFKGTSLISYVFKCKEKKNTSDICRTFSYCFNILDV